ncbi:MAG: hypothetical protein J6T98_02025 [Salinivirgaceae bacterium]|nr:hypothetical protein [Salinivirgaceae bacterium]
MRILPLITLLLAVNQLFGQTPLNKTSQRTITQISPYYFGPNAFAVPEMLDGRVQTTLRAELATDYFKGFRGDRTVDAAFKLNVPLWTDRVNLSVWMPAMEWYRNTDESLAACRVQDENIEDARSGHLAGDVYVSTDMQILRESDIIPDLVLRAALKTASGFESFHARYYDSPGYFFDISVGKSVAVGQSEKWKHRLRAALTTGFLCWQTDLGRQNDATQFGVMGKWENTFFSLSVSLAGYSGWEHNNQNGELAHDRPTVLRSDLVCHFGQLDAVAVYQYGLRDYPYHLLRLGVAYRLDILSIMK